jgi:hypothetical protein
MCSGIVAILNDLLTNLLTNETDSPIGSGPAYTKIVSAGKPANKKGILELPGCLLYLMEDTAIVKLTLSEEK